MATARPKLDPLPIDAGLPEVVASLALHPALVLRAPTGAGKTTRVPPALLAAGLAGGRQVVMLEPRRIAARAAARRIAAEQGWDVGAEVGYQIRFERRAGKLTRILIVTEGILVQMLQSDPFLEGVGVVVFDEFHERNLHADLSLAMVRRVQQEVRSDLKLVVMSATLDAGPLAEYLGDCPVMTSEGRLYPVEIAHLPQPDPRPMPLLAAWGVRRVVAERTGDVLVFLPGVGEIRRTAEQLAALATEQNLALMPLYGELSGSEQDAVLAPCERRKVVLATNVAETSITIAGIGSVVDTGQVRLLRYDPASGLDRLELTRASRAAVEQRAGRAGRDGPGFCLRLWSEHDHRSLPERETAEVRRVDLTAPVLQLLAWGESDPARFPWFEAPEPPALERALVLLADLGARDRAGITELGRMMARLPLHPRLARLVIEGHRRGARRRAALAAALLSERDLVHRPAGARPVVAQASSVSDVLDRLEALESFERRGSGETALGPIHGGRARWVLQAGRDIARLAERALGREPVPEGDSDEALLRALLAAYPDRLARRREAASRRGVMVGGRGVRLAEMSAVDRGELFLCIEVDAGHAGPQSEGLVRQASAVEPGWLPTAAATGREEIVFDPDKERVVGYRRTFYRDLLLTEAEYPVDLQAAAPVLAVAAAECLEQALPLDDSEIATFLARLRSLVYWRPELGLPTFEREELIELLPMLAAGKRSFAELRRAPLLDVLRGSLRYDQLQTLEREAPERLEVPSGSRVRLDYEPGKAPVLAVRIQEMFGQRETPTVASGRVPVLLHLLAPNHRPQQVTQDLRSFWQNVYPQVRKELAGRYPKHAWPEDPLAARPERRGGRA